MNDILDFIYNLPWYVVVGFFVWLAWTTFYNQNLKIQNLKKNDPEAYEAWVKEVIAKQNKPKA